MKKIANSVGLLVNFLLIIELDNKKTRDLRNDWSVGERMLYFDIL
jgi:hypothetical protein